MGSRVTRRGFARFLAGGALAAASAQQAKSEASRPENEVFSFGVIADVQYCDADPAGTRFYRDSLRKLRECVHALNQQQLAFTIQLGDLIDRGVASYDAVLPIYEELASPHYHVLGNHDYWVSADKLDDVPRLLGLKDRYYSFHYRKWRFITLDGNEVSVFAHRAGSPEHDSAVAVLESLKEKSAPNAQTWNGAVGAKQLSWLDRQLAEADTAQQRVIIFCHYPAYPANAHNLWNDGAVLEILDGHRCVVAYLCGHNHAGNYGRKNGIHYVTFPGMVETEQTTAFAVVHVQSDCLRIAGQGRTPGRVLEFPS